MKRVASIDIIRALTMLTMLFVNDFAGFCCSLNYSGMPDHIRVCKVYEYKLIFCIIYSF